MIRLEMNVSYKKDFWHYVPSSMRRIFLRFFGELDLEKHPRSDLFMDWFRRMQFSSESRVILHNFLREHRAQNVLDFKKKIWSFLDEIADLISKERKSKKKYTGISLASKAVERKRFYLRGRKIPRKNFPRVSRIVNAFWAVPYLFQKSTVISDSLEDVLEMLKLEGEMEVESKRTLPWGVLPRVWVTKAEKVEKTVCHCDVKYRASTLRTQLGLPAYYNHKFLIEILYPDGFVPPRIKIPTVFDAVDNPYFRTVRSMDGWGKTVHLETWGGGMPEAVHEPCPYEPGFIGRWHGENLITQPKIDFSEYERYSQNLVAQMF